MQLFGTKENFKKTSLIYHGARKARGAHVDDSREEISY